jgi:hypothetical protein
MQVIFLSKNPFCLRKKILNSFQIWFAQLLMGLVVATPREQRYVMYELAKEDMLELKMLLR